MRAPCQGYGEDLNGGYGGDGVHQYGVDGGRGTLLLGFKGPIPGYGRDRRESKAVVKATLLEETTLDKFWSSRLEVVRWADTPTTEKKIVTKLPKNQPDRPNLRRQQLRKRMLKIGTWNIQGLGTKQKEVIGEIQEMNMDIVILTETKKKGKGEERLGNYIQFWSGVEKHVRAKSGVAILIKNKWIRKVTDVEYIDDRIMKVVINIFGQIIVIFGVYAINDDATIDIKESFFEKLDEEVGKVNSNHEVIIIGDLNSRVGKLDDDVVGRFGEETKNDNGNRLINLCREQEYVIANTKFQHKEIHKYTWENPTRGLKSIIDLIIVRKNRKMVVQDVRVHRKPECGTDHHMVVGKFLIFGQKRLRNRDGSNQPDLHEIDDMVYKTDLLKEESIKWLYQNRIKHKLDMEIQGTPEKMYEHMTHCIKEAAQEALGTKNNIKKYRENFSIQLEQLIENKKKAYLEWIKDKDINSRKKYVELRRNVKVKVREEKNQYWENLCRDISNSLPYNRSTEAWKTIKNIRSSKKERGFIQVISPVQWIEHYIDLLQEHRLEYLQEWQIGKIENPVIEITEEDVEKAIRRAKNNKAPGPGNIRMELLKYGGNNLIKYITKMFNKIENGEQIPKEWNKSYITSIYKKGDKKCVNNYRGISVLPSIMRIFARVIKDKINNIVIFKEEQSGFRSNRSCLDNIHCIRLLIEKNKAKNIETHMTFIDLEKAYDSIPRIMLWTAMERMNIPLKWINIVKQIYRNTTAQIKLGRRLTQEIVLTKGLKQGCTLSPMLFNIYVDQALEVWYKKCDRMGFEIGDKTFHSLLFADDQVLFAQDGDDMEYMVRKIDEEYRKWGLNINYNKTEYMCIGKEVSNLVVNNEIIKKCDSFKYLGSHISSLGTCQKDIDSKIALGRQATRVLHGLIWNKNISKEVKKMMFHSLVENIMLYGAEMWPVTQKTRDRIRTVELDYMRRCLQLTREDRIRTEKIWDKMEINCSITKKLENKQLQWYGHVERMPEERWPKQILQYSPKGTRGRGRPTMKWKSHIINAMDDRGLQMGDWNDRQLWKQKTNS